PPEVAAPAEAPPAVGEFGVPIKTKGKAKKPPRAKKDRPPKVKKEKPPKKARKPKKPRKGEAPAMPAPPAAPPAYEEAPPAYVEAPPTVAPPPEAPPTFEAPAPPPAPPAYEEAPPAFQEAPPAYKEPVIPGPPPAYEEPPPSEAPPAEGAPETEAPPEYGPPEVAEFTAQDEEPAEVPPWEVEAPPEVAPQPQAPSVPLTDVEAAPVGAEDFPGGFTEGDGMMEQVRPEHVTEEDYILPEEYQELMGRPEVPVAHDEPAGEVEAVPEEAPTDVSVAPHEEPELGAGTEWPFDEAPAAEIEEQETSSPLPAEEPPAPAAVPGEDIELEPEAEEGVTVEGEKGPGETPKQGSTSQEELHSFFFEGDVDKKGQEQKKDPDSFWD
ncbi:MAG: hypothetical protein KKE56_07595, partial [Actinobacteria bacterium]|nr:hypothetical protein [Actinomycetota bacterium]